MSASHTSRNHDQFLNDVNETIPSSIKILTVLTFIGSAIGLVLTIFLPKLNDFMLGVLEKAGNSDQDIPASSLAEIEQGKSSIQLMQANLLPIMLSGFIGIALCVWGAIWMRKLKKDGYWLYLAGELLPLIVSFVILGTAQFNGVFSVIIGVVVPLVFISLYSLQRKFLVN